MAIVEARLRASRNRIGHQFGKLITRFVDDEADPPRSRLSDFVRGLFYPEGRSPGAHTRARARGKGKGNDRKGAKPRNGNQIICCVIIFHGMELKLFAWAQRSMHVRRTSGAFTSAAAIREIAVYGVCSGCR